MYYTKQREIDYKFIQKHSRGLNRVPYRTYIFACFEGRRAERQRDRETERERDRETERQRETEREIRRERPYKEGRTVYIIIVHIIQLL